MKKHLVFVFVLITLFSCQNDDNTADNPQKDPDPTMEEPTPNPNPDPDPDPKTTCTGEGITFVNEALSGNCPGAVDTTWQSAVDAGITVRTFDQDAAGRTITRRYLQYLPEGYNQDKTYPLVIFLHGANINAEIARQFDTHLDLEKLADENGFVIVYGNAAANPPPENSDPWTANFGIWVNTAFGGLDTDLEYFEMIDADLQAQGIQIDAEARFIAGVSNGGQMAIEAAQNLETYSALYAGVPAPMMVQDKKLDVSSYIFYSINDPLALPFFENSAVSYDQLVDDMIERLAKTIDIDQETIDDITYTPLPDKVVEGVDYAGDVTAAVISVDSTLEEVELLSPNSGNKIRVMRTLNGGHGTPHPIQHDTMTAEFVGFRNQDVNSVTLMWEFFEQFL